MHLRQLRLALIGAAIALVPFSAGVANAQTAASPADLRAQANLANDLAQCQLAASGAKVNGMAGLSVPLPTGVPVPSCSPRSAPSTNTSSPAAATSSTSSMGTCVAAQRALTHQEMSLVNDYEIALAKAQANHGTLEMTPDVAALIGCE